MSVSMTVAVYLQSGSFLSGAFTLILPALLRKDSTLFLSTNLLQTGAPRLCSEALLPSLLLCSPALLYPLRLQSLRLLREPDSHRQLLLGTSGCAQAELSK